MNTIFIKLSLSSSQTQSSGGKPHLTLLWGESQSTECILQCLDLLKQLLTLVRECLDVHRSQCALKNRSYRMELASQVIKGQLQIKMA